MKNRKIFTMLIIVFTISIISTLYAAEIKSIKSFGDWKTSGTLSLTQNNSLTILMGKHSGGEIQKTFTFSSKQRYKYVTIARVYEQGEWDIFVRYRKKRIQLSPIKGGVKILTYDISPYLKNTNSIDIAIMIYPGAEVKIRNICFQNDVAVSKKYIATLYKGQKRYFDTPAGKFLIPNKFECVSKRNHNPGTLFTNEEKKAGAVWYQLDNCEDITPVRIPSRRKIGRKIVMFASPKQYEGTSFSIYALKNISKVKLKCNSLRTRQGKVIPDKNIEIRKIFCWPQRIDFVSLQYKLVPELLLKQDNNTFFRKNQSSSYWINIHIPPNTLPGLYESNIEIYCSDGKILSIPLKMRVLGLKLLNDPNAVFGTYSGHPKHFEYIKKYGINSVINGNNRAFKGLFKPLEKIAARESNIVKRQKMLYAGKDLPQLDFSGFERYAKAWKNAGMSSRMIVWFIDDFAGSSKNNMSVAKFLNIPMSDNRLLLRRYPKKITPEFKSLFKACIRAIDKKAKELGIVLYFKTFDEVGATPGVGFQAYVIEIFKLIKEAGGNTILTCYQDEFTEQISPWLDVRQYINMETDKKDKLKSLRKSLKKSKAMFFKYGNSTNEKFWHNRFLFGFKKWVDGNAGQLSWTLFSNRNNPFNDFDSKHKDAIMLYNAQNEIPEIGFIPTIQLEAIRAGINDSKYIYTLQNLINKGLESENSKIVDVAKKAKKELSAIKHTIPCKSKDIKSGSWDFRNFKRYRWRIAYLAMLLQDLFDNKKLIKKKY